MSMKQNILIAGVGGQGSLLASRILGSLFIGQGLDVKVSEVHGMSQRGGSVITYVRAAEKVTSPLIPEGEADLLIALELLEAARWASHLTPGGLVCTSIQRVAPMPVVSGAMAYPEDLLDELEKTHPGTVAVDALSLALEAGSSRAANIVMLGAAAHRISQDRELWDKALRACIPERFLEMNLAAFALGQKAVRS